MSFKKPTSKIDDFISSAPDGHGEPVATTQAPSKQITLRVPDQLLSKIDETAKSRGISRASFFKLAATKLIDELE